MGFRGWRHSDAWVQNGQMTDMKMNILMEWERRVGARWVNKSIESTLSVLRISYSIPFSPHPIVPYPSP